VRSVNSFIMWTLYIKEGGFFTTEKGNRADSFVCVGIRGFHSYFFAETPVIKSSVFPKYDSEMKTPYYFPSLWGDSLRFVVKDSVFLFKDKIIASGEVPISSLSLSNENRITLGSTHQTTTDPYLVIVLIPPKNELKVSPLLPKDNHFYLFLSFNPPISSFEEAQTIEFSLIHSSTHAGEIHKVEYGKDHPGLYALTQPTCLMPTGFTQIYDYHKGEFSLSGSLGYKTNNDCVFIPLIHNKGNYVGTVYVNYAASKEKERMDKDLNWNNVKHFNPDSFHVISKTPIVVESQAFYAGGISMNPDNGEYKNIPLSTYMINQFDQMISDFAKLLIDPEIRPWTRLHSTAHSSLTIGECVKFHQIEYPENFIFEAGWRETVQLLHLTVTPFDSQFKPISKGLLKNGYPGIKIKNGESGDYTIINNIPIPISRPVDGEKISIKTKELENNVQFILIGFEINCDTSIIQNLHVRIQDKMSKVELMYIPIAVPLEKSYVGLLHKMPNGLWEFKQVVGKGLELEENPNFSVILDPSF